jgi:hypothetical protein
VKNQDEIFDHLKYAMKHVDGLCWLLLDPNRSGPLQVLVNEQPVLKRPDLGQVRIAIAEAGLINCRKLLDFLGLRANRQRVLEEISGRRHWPDDVGIEDLVLQRVSLTAYDKAPFTGPVSLRSAAEHTLQAADKGVAHFTLGIGTPARSVPVLMCAQAVLWLTEEHVYRKLGLPVPDYRIWTEG